MTGNYYNTNNLKPSDVPEAVAQSQRQSALVLKLFADNPAIKRATAWEVRNGLIKHHLIDPATPITSIRRAMSDLSKAGQLEKLSETRMGPFKKPEHYFKPTDR